MSKKIVVLLFIFIGLLQSCNTTEPPPPDEKLTLTLILEDASSIEAWIKLTTTNLSAGGGQATLTLKQNDKVRSTINLVKPDTLLYIDSLLPNTTYSFHAAIQPSNQTEVKSNVLNITTMDTTSHDFTWQTVTFGEHSSSMLRDVAIIDENNIWAVGEIYMNDSLGQPDPHAYNAVHWDGSEWEMKRIQTYFRGNLITVPLEGIFAFTATDIWMVGSLPIHGDGTNWTMYDLRTTVDPNLSLSKAWGSNSNDMYFVGRAGSIAHYSGPTGGWQKIESGTSTIINDVWGIISDQNKTILYCPVSSFFVPGDKKILKIIDGKVDSVSWNRDVRLYSGWAMNENFLFVCGEGAYENMFGIWTQIDLPEVGTNSIRGNNINDIFIVGDYGFITHFNGVRWKLLSTFSDKGYSEVSIKGNTVAVSGRQLGYGLIEIGTRN